MSGEVFTSIGRLSLIALGSSAFGLFFSIFKYYVRRQAYMSSRLEAMKFAVELDDMTIKNFVKLSPHFRAEELRFDPVASPKHDTRTE